MGVGQGRVRGQSFVPPSDEDILSLCRLSVSRCTWSSGVSVFFLSLSRNLGSSRLVRLPVNYSLVTENLIHRTLYAHFLLT